MERDLPLGRAGSNGVLLNGTYQFIRNLGHGAFGKVKVARHLPTGCKVAIKILNRRKIREKEMEDKAKGITTFGMDKVAREITISKMLVHPHIVRVYEVIETPTDIYVVMEYAERGELFDYIVMNRRVQEDEARKFFQQIISGLECCHSYRVVHRDLKPENLLLDSNGNLKIADFGLSNIMQDGHFLRTCCGSPNYAAPEVISGRPYAGPEIDVWSCGVIMYALLAGTLPFDDESIPNLYNKIKQGIYTLPSHLSPGAKDLIARMLVVDPLKRITIPEIRTHSWFKTNLLGYLAVPCLDAVTSQMRKLNEEILLRVITMGHDQNFLVHSLQNKIHNDGTVSYYLLLDNYYRSNNCYSVELDSAGEPHSAAAAVHVGESSQSSGTHQIGRAVNQQGIDLVPHTQSDGRWNLGLRFGAHPHQVMAIVLQTLQNLNVGWKKIGQYNMKCRWSPKSDLDLDLNLNLNGHFQDTVALLSNSYSSSDMLTDNVPQNTVKFELQLYKTLSENYLLDLQRIMGPQLLFLDLCTNFLAQLQLI